MARKTKAPDFREIASSRDGRDITLGYVDGLSLLPPADAKIAPGDLATYAELLTDDQVAACFMQRRMAVVSAPLVIEPGGPRRRDRIAAQALREELARLDLDRITDQMLYGVFFGWAVAEVLWAREGGRITIADIRVRHPARFGFAPDGSLRLLTMAHPDGEPVPPAKFWHFTAGGFHGDDPYGLPLARRVYWPVFFKRHGVKFWMMFLEKFGQPTLVARASAHDPALVQRLLDVLSQLHADAAAVVPESVQIDTLEAKRSGSADYAALVEAMDRAIARAILGQTASVEGTPGKLGEEGLRGEVRREIAEADARLVMGSFRRQVARWWTEWNFPGAAVPIVRRDLSEPEDLRARAERDRIIASMGFRPTLAYVRATYGGDWEQAAPAAGAGAAFAEDTEGGASHPAEVLADRLAREGEPLVQAWLEKLVQMAEAASDMEELRAMVQAAWPELDHEAITRLLAQAQTAAHIAGGLDAAEESA